jgi:DNA-binding MarR family transcriptional regulator
VRVSEEFVATNPLADPTATELVINLLVTATLLQGKLERLLRESRLTVGSFNVLQVVAGDPEPLTPSEIAARIAVPVTTATITAVLDTLERNGYIERRPHPSDRRRLLVHLTANGRRTLAKVVPRVLAGEKEWTAAVTGPARARLTDGLAALQEGLRATA